MSKLSALSDWLDERTEIRQTLRHLLDEPIRGGARWSYVFGGILLFLFLLQAITGIFLSLYYVPSSDHAHASVAYIQKNVPGGALLRGLHHYGASAMVIFAVVHLAQAFIFGAYKKKRELVWVVGTVLFILILAFSFTGYLLPWDQAAYFGTKVGTSIAGEIPLIGSIQQRIILGGNDLTTLTLSRFYTTHVFLLPLAVGLLVVLHIYLFRKAGPAGPFHQRDDARVESFYPTQMFKDSVAVLIVFVALVVITKIWSTELGPEANPGSDYLARPPWYFLPLFELLKYFPGKFSIIPTVILPAVIFSLMFLLPFFDRRDERHPSKRPFAISVLTLILIASIELILLSKYQDKMNPDFSARLKEQDEEMRGFLASPFRPQLIGTSMAATSQRYSQLALKVGEPPGAFTENCADCHGARGEGDSGPPLIGITTRMNRSKNDLLNILIDSRSYGLKKPMPATFSELTEEDKQRIVEWLDQTRLKMEE
ncbi:MAG: cytochrome b N-terminal domain-containing protein [Acidobacteria bacterium]|nr:cytochrome b N-terminal domain-containing protein [Acidobacteriota bacterium]